ncbi:unnamed protein product, partial [Brassica rapa subsp. trilocularis]
KHFERTFRKFSATKLCRCIDQRLLRRRLRIVSASSPSSSVHRLHRRLCIASASSPISPHLRIASALSPIHFRHYKLAFYDDVVSKVFSFF